MNKKEFQELIRKIQIMQAMIQTLSQELDVVAIRLRFIPVSQDSSSSDDEVEYECSIRSRMTPS